MTANQVKPKIDWRPRFEKSRWMFFGNVNETHYTIEWRKELKCYCVSDNHGATWGEFKTPQAAMKAVESNAVTQYGMPRIAT